MNKEDKSDIKYSGMLNNFILIEELDGFNYLNTIDYKVCTITFISRDIPELNRVTTQEILIKNLFTHPTSLN